VVAETGRKNPIAQIITVHASVLDITGTKTTNSKAEKTDNLQGILHENITRVATNK
jgi:hypothetical protein